MKSTIMNVSNADVVLPPSFSGVTLSPLTSQNFTYSSISNADLATMVALVKAAKIEFPGNTGAGILAGLQVTPTLTYVINGQEPAGQPLGATVFSISDNTTRTLVNLSPEIWASKDKSYWVRPAASPSRNIAFGQSVVALRDGRFMVIGGGVDFGGFTADCQFYDPSMNQFSPAPPLPGPVAGAASCLLKDGKVFVCGGVNDNAGWTTLATTYVFDPKANSGAGAWATKAAMPTATAWLPGAVDPQNCVTLKNGKVLVCGGDQNVYADFAAFSAGVYGDVSEGSNKTYIYDPAANTWATVANTPEKMISGFCLTLLNNGKVFLVGGSSIYSAVSKKTALYDVGANTWTASADLPVTSDCPNGGRVAFGMVALRGNEVLVAGGWGNGYYDLAFIAASALIYDVAAGTWTEVGPMPQGRMLWDGGRFALAAQQGGGALWCGGGDEVPFDRAEVFAYDNVSQTWVVDSLMPNLGGEYTDDLEFDIVASMQYPVRSGAQQPDGTVFFAGSNFFGPGGLDGNLHIAGRPIQSRVHKSTTVGTNAQQKFKMRRYQH